MNNLLVVFAKDPNSHKVKTRLAKEIGEESAKRIYLNVLDKIIAQNKNQSYDLMLYVHGNKNYYSSYNIISKQQNGSNLGEKLYNAFSEELKNYKRVIIVGSDLPTINFSMIKKAFLDLENSDIVLGPAYDGGYYLVGMKKLLNIFNLDKWSHSNVLKDTVQIIAKNAYSYALLHTERDIDTKEDLNYYEKSGIIFT